MARVGGAQEVQFFAANLLLNKVRREWGRLPAESQGQLSQAFSARLNEMVGAGDQVARVVVNRVAMVMAVAAVQTSVKAAEAVLNSMLQTLAAGAGSDSNPRWRRSRRASSGPSGGRWCGCSTCGPTRCSR